MKICIAQTQSKKGDVEWNIQNHGRIIDEAVSQGADMIVFPELSLTGYKPELADQLATTKGDRRFEEFQ